MRLLLDNNLPPRLTQLLTSNGLDAVHVRDMGLARASDADVIRAAHAAARVVVSADTDFGTLLARSGGRSPSVVLIRTTHSRRAEQLAQLLTSNLPSVADELATGAVVVLTDARLRVRRLPLPPA